MKIIEIALFLSDQKEDIEEITSWTFHDYKDYESSFLTAEDIVWKVLEIQGMVGLYSPKCCYVPLVPEKDMYTFTTMCLTSSLDSFHHLALRLKEKKKSTGYYGNIPCLYQNID